MTALATEHPTAVERPTLILDRAESTPTGDDQSVIGVRNTLRHRPSSVWREIARGRLADLRADLDGLPAECRADPRFLDAQHRLTEAEEIVNAPPSLRGLLNGAAVEASWIRIHAIDVAVLRLAGPELVRARLPEIVSTGKDLLGDDHEAVATLRAVMERAEWTGQDRETLAHSAKAVHAASDSESIRLRSYRNILLGATAALALLAVCFGVVGALRPDTFGLVSTGNSMPRADIAIAALLGLVSASLVGAVAIRRMKGTSTAYALPMASLLLKLPTGALTAVAGLLMVKAGIAGDGVNLTTNAHLVGYSLLFGASQQGITGLVDRQTQSLLDNVASKDNS
ncbi:hypothetical protein [Mycolicibacterium sp. HK-90]|uniref:hypothetical protein n=1 Tax=Mycolicibacterium sp. HK-90 TaxID=3056937 RepID=UPI00265A56EB|nr:hypothetical protein [Mycolicibacterium sp. HK-90]WKG00762.1 hypothetical protein QU592_15650 [Mycolicibacterium sp. HK-90]